MTRPVQGMIAAVVIVAVLALGVRIARAGADERDQRLIDTEARLIERAPTLRQLKADQAVDEGIVQAFGFHWDDQQSRLVPLQ